MIRKILKDFLHTMHLVPLFLSVSLLVNLFLVKNYHPEAHLRTLDIYTPIYYNIVIVILIALLIGFYLFIKKGEKYKIIVSLFPIWVFCLVFFIAMFRLILRL